MKFKLIFILLFISFNLKSMSPVLNNPGKYLVTATLNGHKNKVTNILQEEKIANEYKNEALWTAISRNNRELVDILIDNGALLPDKMSFFRFWRDIGEDKNKIELFSYVAGFLFVTDKQHGHVKEDSDYLWRIVVNAYQKYVNDNKNPTKEDIIRLRYDNKWLKFIISEGMSLQVENVYKNPYFEGNRKDFYFTSIFLPFLNAKCKQEILEIVQQRNMRKFVRLIKSSLDMH